MNPTDIYLVIGPLSVDGMTAQQPDIVAGYPAPTAVAGLGYKFALDLSKTQVGKVMANGTAVVVHDHSVMDGHVKLPLEDKAKIRQNKGASILDERRARASISIVISLDFENDVQDDIIVKHAQDLLPGLYFAGGKAFPVCNGQPAKVLVAKNHDGLASALREVPPGYVLLDRSDLMQGAADEKDPLDILLDLIEFVPQDSGDGQPRHSRRQPGWLVPVFVGYQAIEGRQIRRGVRHAEAIGHVFAESIYSVGEFRSVRGILAKDPDALASAFWKHNYNSQTETYFVSAAN